MIDILDLRIFDYVKCKTSNDAALYQILAIDGLNLKVILSGAREADGWIGIDKIKPVIVTPEILEEFGFKKHIRNASNPHRPQEDFIVYDLYPKRGEFLYSFTMKGKLTDSFYETPEIDGGTISIGKYVHELQNIYFDITKQRLRGTNE